MERDKITQIENTLCRFMQLSFCLGTIWSIIVLANGIIQLTVQNTTVTNACQLCTTIFSIIMLIISLFWIAFAIANRIGLLDKMENWYINKIQKG